MAYEQGVGDPYDPCGGGGIEGEVGAYDEVGA